LIPRIFHQVWINDEGQPVPDEYAAYTATWLRLHPGWEYRLWNLDNLDFALRRPELIPQAKSYSQMSDLLRFEVLYRYGGVYIDTDFEPFKCIEPLLDGVRMFLCSEDGETLTASIVGAEESSPLFLRLLDELPEQIGLEAPNIETGPTYVTRTLLTGGFGDELTLLPTRYFFPYNTYDLYRKDESFPDAYAAHRYAHSWTWDTKLTLAQKIKRRLGKIARAAMGRD
jgi:mannosyltransferase OCH1-like enzyme